MKPKYRVRETSPGTFVAEIRRLFFFWQSLEHIYTEFGSYAETHKSVKAAEAAIEKHYREYLAEKEEKARKRYVKEYTPVANSPLDKALE